MNKCRHYRPPAIHYGRQLPFTIRSISVAFCRACALPAISPAFPWAAISGTPRVPPSNLRTAAPRPVRAHHYALQRTTPRAYRYRWCTCRAPLSCRALSLPASGITPVLRKEEERKDLFYNLILLISHSRFARLLRYRAVFSERHYRRHAGISCKRCWLQTRPLPLARRHARATRGFQLLAFRVYRRVLSLPLQSARRALKRFPPNATTTAAILCAALCCAFRAYWRLFGRASAVLPQVAALPRPAARHARGDLLAVAIMVQASLLPFAKHHCPSTATRLPPPPCLPAFPAPAYCPPSLYTVVQDSLPF